MFSFDSLKFIYFQNSYFYSELIFKEKKIFFFKFLSDGGLIIKNCIFDSLKANFSGNNLVIMIPKLTYLSINNCKFLNDKYFDFGGI